MLQYTIHILLDLLSRPLSGVKNEFEVEVERGGTKGGGFKRDSVRAANMSNAETDLFLC